MAPRRKLDCDILIAGGGFVGMALALALADETLGKGFDVILADAAAPNPDRGRDWRASAITAASCRMLKRLGVWQWIGGDNMQSVSAMAISDGVLEQVARPSILNFDTQGAADDGLDAAIIVKNQALLNALRRRVEDSAAIKFLAPCQITGFAVDALSVEAVGGEGPVTAQLLVGADGGGSKIRQAAGIKTVHWDYGQWGIVAEIELSRPHKGRAVQHFLPSGPFAMLPLPENKASLVWSEKEAEARRLLELDNATFCAELLQRLGRQFGDVRITGGPQGFALGLSLAREFVRDRLALVGDAAHKVHPLAGQGVNLGFKDVAVLTDILKTARGNGEAFGGLAVLERYQQWRRFDSVSQAMAMDGLNRLFSNQSASLRVARDVGMGLVERVPALKNFLVREAAGDTGKVPPLMMR